MDLRTFYTGTRETGGVAAIAGTSYSNYHHHLHIRNHNGKNSRYFTSLQPILLHGYAYHGKDFPDIGKTVEILATNFIKGVLK